MPAVKIHFNLTWCDFCTDIIKFTNKLDKHSKPGVEIVRIKPAKISIYNLLSRGVEDYAQYAIV